MSDTVIRVENLGKLYRLGEIGTGTISHDLNRWWARVRGKEDPFAKVGQLNDRTQANEGDYVWALKDINFEVKRGEVLGIIGRNGAGKSTLLKILSKVTTATEGQIKVKGRIASLLEVGTGFHPELTGRENIFLNGAILGMTRAEIRSKFDEMVAFAGVERYIDTPVKRYSSGMYVRLAFAVAAFLEPEILIVDEVLAVGDAEFQRKCIGKMKEVSESNGRTVLFVSHNLSQVQSLCTRGIFMDKGMLVFDGSVSNALNRYVQGSEKALHIDLVDFPRAGQLINGLRFTHIALSETAWQLYELQRLNIELFYEVTADLDEVVFGVTLSDAFQTLVECRSGENYSNISLRKGQMGVVKTTLELFLKAGNYTLNVGARSINGLLDYIPSITTIEILPPVEDNIEIWKKASVGILITKSKWETE
jgi:lipopolysaccharide transport system ATP-binding protein